MLAESLWEASGRCLPCAKGDAERCNSQIRNKSLGFVVGGNDIRQLFNNVISDVF